MTDKEMYMALLDGEKLEKVRQAGSGRYVYLEGDLLVDNEKNPAILYKMDSSDFYKIFQEK